MRGKWGGVRMTSAYTFIVGDLDKGINVIVGQNGGGKSNILGALEYVFTCKEKYWISVPSN